MTWNGNVKMKNLEQKVVSCYEKGVEEEEGRE